MDLNFFGSIAGIRNTSYLEPSVMESIEIFNCKIPSPRGYKKIWECVVEPFSKLYEERSFLLDSMQQRSFLMCVATIEKAIILFC